LPPESAEQPEPAASSVEVQLIARVPLSSSSGKVKVIEYKRVFVNPADSRVCDVIAPLVDFAVTVNPLLQLMTGAALTLPLSLRTERGKGVPTFTEQLGLMVPLAITCNCCDCPYAGPAAPHTIDESRISAAPRTTESTQIKLQECFASGC
jgi:hypothetical protein